MMSDVKDMSVEELEKALAKKKKAQNAERERMKKEYEKARSKVVLELTNKALDLHYELKEFKKILDHEMELQANRLNEYGAMRKNSKGGFTIKDATDSFKVTRRRNTQPEWDERADKAEELLMDFFGDTIKKRDAKLGDMLMSYLVKNKEGQLKYASVMKLMQHRDKFDDARWKEALKLLEESFRSVLSKYYYVFASKNEQTGEWEPIELTMSSL